MAATVKGSGNGGNKITLDTTSSNAAIKIEKTGSGTVNMDSADVGPGNTAQFRELKYTDSNGQQQTIKVLSTEAVTIPPGGGGSGSQTEDVITGISFGFDSSTHQLTATLTKKRLTVISKADISGDAPTATLPLYENDVVVGSDYNDSVQHVFNNFTRKGVITGSDSQSTPAPVFTSTAHSSE